MTKYGPLKKATAAEVSHFNQLTILEMERPKILNARGVFKNMRDPLCSIGKMQFKDIDGNIHDLTCIDDYQDASKRAFDCFISLNNEDEFIREPDNATEKGTKYLGKSPLREVRYGDIDNDKDIDIAIKTAKGEVFVFHAEKNSGDDASSKKPLQAPLPPHPSAASSKTGKPVWADRWPSGHIAGKSQCVSGKNDVFLLDQARSDAILQRCVHGRKNYEVSTTRPPITPVEQQNATCGSGTMKYALFRADDIDCMFVKRRKPARRR